MIRFFLRFSVQICVSKLENKNCHKNAYMNTNKNEKELFCPELHSKDLERDKRVAVKIKILLLPL